MLVMKPCELALLSSNPLLPVFLFHIFLLIGSLTFDEFNKLADQTNDFAVDERGEAVGDDGIMSSHPPSFVRNRLKEENSQQLLSLINNSQEQLGKE